MRETGSEFDHFFCPILLQDEVVELCDGHIVSDCLPNSSRKTVIQRKDVDNFFGSQIEGDVAAYIAVKHSPDVSVLQKNLLPKIKPQIIINREVCNFYPAPKHHRPGDTLIEFEGDNGNKLLIGMSKHHVEAASNANSIVGLQVEFDCTFPMFVASLRSAFLTMFYLCGYRYALSAAGMFIGQVLRDVYVQLPQAPCRETYGHQVVGQWPHMIKPIIARDPQKPPDFQGTIEDGKAVLVMGGSGRCFSIGLITRTDGTVQTVFLPIGTSDDQIATWYSFVRQPPSSVELHPVKWSQEKEKFLAYANPYRKHFLENA